MSRRDARPGGDAERARVRRRDVRVDADVHVEEDRLRPLEEDLLPRGDRVVEERHGVADVRLQPVRVCEVRVADRREVEGRLVVDPLEDPVLLVEVEPQALLEASGLVEVADADSSRMATRMGPPGPGPAGPRARLHVAGPSVLGRAIPYGVYDLGT